MCYWHTPSTSAFLYRIHGAHKNNVGVAVILANWGLKSKCQRLSNQAAYLLTVRPATQTSLTEVGHAHHVIHPFCLNSIYENLDEE